MTKIYFISDPHFGKKYSYQKDYELNISRRNLHVINNCEKIINQAITDKADFVIFLGDVYDRQTISPTIRRFVRERVFIPLFKSNISTIIIGGNHDSVRNPKRGVDLQELANFPNIEVFTDFKTKIINKDGIKIGLLLLPYIHFDVLVDIVRSKGFEIPKHQDNYIIAQRIIRNYISDIYKKELKDCDKRILIGHYYLTGAKIRETNNPSAIYGDFAFNQEMIQKELFDLVIFGHVHLKQTMWNDDRIIIPGSVERIDIGERDSDKFYCIYEVETDKLEYREISCRNMFKFEITIPDKIDDINTYILNQLPEQKYLKESISRVIINFPKGLEIHIDKYKLEDYFKDSFHHELIYFEKEIDEFRHLREVNLDPINLFNSYIDQEFSDYANYKKLKENGLEFLQRQIKSYDMITSGPLSIKSIDIQNFNNYGIGPNNFNFNFDSCVIKGPTGSGKSSILDAITFALFKSSSRLDIKGVNLENVLYDNGYVNLTLLIGDNLFRVNRYKKGKAKTPKLELKFNDKDLGSGLSIPQKEEKIESIIGYDYEGFISSFFIRQQELQIFSIDTPAERQKRLSKLFKLKIFQDGYRRIKKIIDDLTGHKKSCEGKIIAYEKFIEKLPQLRKQKKEIYQKISELITEKDNLTKEHDKLEKEIEKYSKDYSTYVDIDYKLEDLLSKKEKIEQEIVDTKNLQKEYNKVAEKLKSFGDIYEKRSELLKQKEVVEEKLLEKTKIETYIQKNQEFLQNIKDQYDKQLEDVQKQLLDTNNRLEKLDTDFTKEYAFDILRNEGKLEERIFRVEKIEIPMAKEYKDQDRLNEFNLLKQKTVQEIEEIKPKQDLITSDIFLVDELSSQKQKSQDNYKKIKIDQENQIIEYKTRIKKLNTLLVEKDLTDELYKHNDKVKKDLADLQNREKEKQNIEKKIKEKKDYSVIIEKLEEDLKISNIRIDEYEKHLKKLKSAYDTCNKLYDKSYELESKIEPLEDTIKDKYTERKYLNKEIEEAVKYEEATKNSKIEIESLKAEIEVYDILRNQVFHENGIPTFAMEKILPAIAIKASAILSELTDGKLNQLSFMPSSRTGFNIMVFDGEQEREVRTFSGGEKTQINASIRFAIMERISDIQDTSGAIFRRSNTLIIDEGDLGTLDDDTSRQRFVDKIQELKARFKNVILITHLEDVAEQFPNRIKVGFDKLGKSKIIN